MIEKKGKAYKGINMAQLYPKKPSQIAVKERRIEIDAGGTAHDDNADNSISLSEKMESYLVRLGYSNTYVLGIIIQLMTQGKIRVEFRNHVERLEVKPSDLLTRTQAAALFEDFVTELQKLQNQTAAPVANVTQRIVVQAPKR